MKKVLFISFLCCFIFLPTIILAKKIVEARNIHFDSEWKFFLGDNPNAQDANFNDNTWRSLELPHDWTIESDFDKKNPMGNDGGYLTAGIGWYRKTFDAPTSWNGKIVCLNFDGVYMNAEVFVNGQFVGKHLYGFTPFQMDITKQIKYGKKNVVSVKVDNSQQKNCRWYSGSGIYRHVTLSVVNPVHITNWGVGIISKVINNSSAKVEVKTKVTNESNTNVTTKVKVTLQNPKHEQCGNATGNISLLPHETKDVTLECSISNPQLWDIDNPIQYQAAVSLQQENKTTNAVTTKFGIRTITYNTEDGLKLNGRSILLNGGCVHHDNGCLGAAAFDRAEIRRVEQLKSAGFNAVRTSHNPPSAKFLDACDSIGLLVIDEAFDGWRAAKNKYDYSTIFDSCWQQDIEAMVLRDRNHPSVFCWSIGNEIIERKSPDAVETGKKLAELVHSLDPSRPVTSAMTTWDKTWDIYDNLFAVHDIGGYNYQLHRATDDHKRVPERLIIQTESYPRDAFENWTLVNDNKYILGDFVWTAIDYLGESGIGRYYYQGETEGEHYQRSQYPWHGAYCGDIDMLGTRKPISHYRDMLYNSNRENLYLAVKEPDGYYGKIKETLWSVWPTWESWTWPKWEGKDIQADIYSHYPKVRLYLNGKLVKEHATGRDEKFRAVITLPYQKGVLKVVGVDTNGNEVESKQLTTAGEAAQMKLIADHTVLSANGQDLAYVIVEIQDKDGIRQPNADNRIHFEVEGQGTIIGVDNALLKDNDSYSLHERNAWKGRAMVVIRSTHKSGNIKLNVTSNGLPNTSIILKSK